MQINTSPLKPTEKYCKKLTMHCQVVKQLPSAQEVCLKSAQSGVKDTSILRECSEGTEMRSA